MKAMAPLHWSLRKQGRHIAPAQMSRIEVTPEQAEAVDSLALSIFTAMTNSGATFQQSLAALYLTGMEHAREVMKTPRSRNDD